MKDFMIRGDRYGFGCIQNTVEIALTHFFVLYGDDAVAIESFDVAAGDTGENRMNLATSHQLRFFDRFLDGVHRAFDIDDNAFAQALRGMRDKTDDFHTLIGHLADDGADFRGANV